MASALPTLQQSDLWTVSFALERRHTSWISWTVRMAQAADRIVDRALNRREPRGERLLEKTLYGLELCCRLIPRQQMTVAAARARLKLDRLRQTRGNRYAQFLLLRREMESRGAKYPYSDEADIHLNPVSSWERITPQRGQEANQPLAGSVLFFLAEDTVRGLRMNLEGQVLINELADYHPCSLSHWAHLSSLADLTQLRALVEHLSDIGLVALTEPTEYCSERN